MSARPAVSHSAPSPVALAERDLIRDRLPFFAVVWSAVSVLWLIALAHRGAPFGWTGAGAIVGVQLAVLGVAVRLTERTSSPSVMRLIVLLAIGLLGFVWTVAASLTAAPFDVVATVMPVLVLIPPLFFAWSWQVELALMTGLGLQAALWFGFVVPADDTTAADIALTASAGAVLGIAVAARVAHEFRLRVARRAQEESSRRALAEAHVAFQASEERFRVAFYRAPIGMAMVGADGSIIQMNVAFERMLGRSASELVGTPVDDLIRAEDLPMARADRDRVLGGAVEALETVMRLRHCDGHDVWARVTRALVRDRDGKPSHMIGQIEDVTERLRGEEALRASERTFRSFAESMAAGVLIVQDGVIRYVNAAVTVITGFPAPDILGQSALFIVDAADRALVAERGTARIRGSDVPVRSEYRVNTKSGEERWVDITVAVIDYQGRPALLGTAFDITERKRAEQALAISERMFRSFAESTAAGVLIVQDEVIRYVNAAVSAITGFTTEELRGMPLRDLVHPADRELAVARAQARLHDASVPTRVEYRLRTKNGGQCWIDLTVGIVEHMGRPALLGTAFDVTERHDAEGALRASLAELRKREEQLRLLAQRQVKVREEERRRLGFDLHDDVCQELVGTGIMVESVRGRLQGVDPEASQKLARVSRHLNELGEHLRLVARELRPMLLHDLGLEDSVRSLAAGMTSAATRVTATSTAPIPRLGEDVEVAVYRIVQEAITNGLRHAGAAEITVSLAASEGVLRVEIRDDGRGFDVKAPQRDALGLVSMEERALALGGKLSLQSAPGQGTSVRLTCPLIRRVPRPAA
jgi:PAS domain S-box-containing protein